MVKFCFDNLPLEMNPGIEEVCKRYDALYSSDGIRINLTKSDGVTGIDADTIIYKNKTDIIRYLVKWINGEKSGKKLTLREERPFDTFGVMVDFSRNAVMHVEGLKDYIFYLACFGVDKILLYLEDTYEVKGYPYMGYMRGRYSADELKKIDSYAAFFGIETVACIQTLGHMAHFLRWEKSYRDNANVLLANDEKTYEFIESCIRTISESISSDYIHVGMDEAFGLGKGRYKSLFGDKDVKEIFTEHIKKVNEICRRYGKIPMIWGDMFTALSSEKGSCFDENVVIDDAFINTFPDVEVVYWDYYSVSKPYYDKMIEAYKTIGKNLWFAGGIWTWETMTHTVERTERTTAAALESCREKGIKNVFATVWSNPIALCPQIASLYGVALWAKEIFVSDSSDAKEEFNMITGADADMFEFYNKLDAPDVLPKQDISKPDQQPASGAMTFLYQSIMCGLFDTITGVADLDTYYSECLERISSYKGEAFKELNDFYKSLAMSLSYKANIGNKLYAAYRASDKEELIRIKDEVLPKLILSLRELISAHRTVWNLYNKPYGFEVIRRYYTAVMADAEDTLETLADYLTGRIRAINQLEQDRLPYRHDFSHNDTGFISDISYSKISTVSRV